jgi:hypothetical protein
MAAATHVRGEDREDNGAAKTRGLDVRVGIRWAPRRCDGRRRRWGAAPVATLRAASVRARRAGARILGCLVTKLFGQGVFDQGKLKSFE